MSATCQGPGRVARPIGLREPAPDGTHPLVPIPPRRGRRSRGLVLIAVGVAIGAALARPWAAQPGSAIGAPATALSAADSPIGSTGRPGSGALAGTASGGIPAPRLSSSDALSRVAERPSPTSPDQLTGYRWPLVFGRITLPFGPIPGGEFTSGGHRLHDGVDLATFCGDRVVAAHTGIVLAAGRHFDDTIGWLGDLGPYYALLNRRHAWIDLPNVVVIDDGNGYRSIYAHFESVTVRPGQRVVAGQLIGYEGATGHASGCHVHYGLFSPLETAAFGVRADIVKQMRVPAFEIARIDPLLVLPGGLIALRTRIIPKPASYLGGDPEWTLSRLAGIGGR